MKVRIALCSMLVAAVSLAMFGCIGTKKASQEFTVLIRMMPAQQRFFEQDIVAKFNKEHNCRISVATFTNQWDIERFLKLDAGKKKPEIGLVKTPFEVTLVMVQPRTLSPIFRTSSLTMAWLPTIPWIWI